MRDAQAGWYQKEVLAAVYFFPLSHLKTIRQIRSSRQLGLMQVNMILIIVVIGFGIEGLGGQNNLRQEQQQEPGF